MDILSPLTLSPPFSSTGTSPVVAYPSLGWWEFMILASGGGLSTVALPKTLFGAIQDKFDASATLTAAIPGGLIKGLAPPDLRDDPEWDAYAEIFLVGNPSERNTGTSFFRDAAFKVRIFAPSNADVVAAAIAWESMFYPGMIPLVWERGYTINVECNDDMQVRNDAQGPDSSRVYGHTILMMVQAVVTPARLTN